MYSSDRCTVETEAYTYRDEEITYTNSKTTRTVMTKSVKHKRNMKWQDNETIKQGVANIAS